jgi:hypothetical protein
MGENVLVNEEVNQPQERENLCQRKESEEDVLALPIPPARYRSEADVDCGNLSEEIESEC